jgi:hypothetical protein
VEGLIVDYKSKEKGAKQPKKYVGKSGYHKVVAYERSTVKCFIVKLRSFHF